MYESFDLERHILGMDTDDTVNFTPLFKIAHHS